MASPRRPLTGPYLTYQITMGGEKYLVRFKESIGNWLGLKPYRGGANSTDDVGTFASGPNASKKFLKAPPSYRFQTYKVLLVPGVKIKEPVPGCNSGQTRTREVCSFDITFSRGPKNARITRWRVKSWLQNTTQAKLIMGMITPSGVKHQWKGKLEGGAGGLPGLPDFGFPGFGGGLPSLPGGLDAGDLINIAGQIGGLLF